MRDEEWEKKGGLVPTVITGAAVAGPENMTMGRQKVKGLKELTRCIMDVGVIHKSRFNGCGVGINAPSIWYEVGVGCTH